MSCYSRLQISHTVLMTAFSDTLVTEPRVAIILLNWNGWVDTVECLESLMECDYSNFTVVVVDNGSTDDSVERIEKWAREQSMLSRRKMSLFTCSGDSDSEWNQLENTDYNIRIILVKSKENLGFSKGNNLGIRLAMSLVCPEFIMLLNNDTVVSSSFMKELVHCVVNMSECAVVGPLVLFYDRMGRKDIISSAGGRVNWWIYPGYYPVDEGRAKGDDESNQRVRLCDWVTGAAMLIPRDMVESQMLDEDFYFGGEDIDFCLRQKRNGCRVAVCLDSVIWHKIGASRGKKERDEGELQALLRDLASNLRVVRRNSSLWPIHVFAQTITFVMMYVKVIISRSFPSVGAFKCRRILTQFLQS